MAENKVFEGVLAERTKGGLEVQGSPQRIRLRDRIVNPKPHSLRAGAGVRDGEHREKG